MKGSTYEAFKLWLEFANAQNTYKSWKEEFPMYCKDNKSLKKT